MKQMKSDSLDRTSRTTGLCHLLLRHVFRLILLQLQLAQNTESKVVSPGLHARKSHNFTKIVRKAVSPSRESVVVLVFELLNYFIATVNCLERLPFLLFAEKFTTPKTRSLSSESVFTFGHSWFHYYRHWHSLLLYLLLVVSPSLEVLHHRSIILLLIIFIILFLLHRRVSLHVPWVCLSFPPSLSDQSFIHFSSSSISISRERESRKYLTYSFQEETFSHHRWRTSKDFFLTICLIAGIYRILKLLSFVFICLSLLFYGKKESNKTREEKEKSRYLLAILWKNFPRKHLSCPVVSSSLLDESDNLTNSHLHQLESLFRELFPQLLVVSSTSAVKKTNSSFQDRREIHIILSCDIISFFFCCQIKEEESREGIQFLITNIIISKRSNHWTEPSSPSSLSGVLSVSLFGLELSSKEEKDRPLNLFLDQLEKLNKEIKC